MKDKTNLIPFSKEWHLELSSKKGGPEPKLKKALHEAEHKQALKLITRAQRKVISVKWSDPSEKLLTLEQVADHFGVSEATIKRAAIRGEIIPERCGKNGKILRFSKTAIDDYKTYLATKRYG